MGTIVRLNRKGQLTLPSPLRKMVHIEPGDYVELKVVDGGLLLTPKVLVDKEQAYFWTEEWQAGERQADADIAAGRVVEFDNADALITDLDAG